MSSQAMKPKAAFCVLKKIGRPMGSVIMTKSGDMRDNARKLKEMADDTPDATKKDRYGKMSKSWTSLANTQARLDGEGSEGAPEQ